MLHALSATQEISFKRILWDWERAFWNRFFLQPFVIKMYCDLAIVKSKYVFNGHFALYLQTDHSFHVSSRDIWKRRVTIIFIAFLDISYDCINTQVTQTFLTHIWTVSRCTLASLPPPLTIITNHFRTNVRIWRGLTRWPESKIAKWRSVCPSEFSWGSLRPQTDPDLKRLMNTKAKDKILFFPAGNFREMRSVPLTKIFSISPSSVMVWVLITRWLIMFPSIVTSYNKRVLKRFNLFDKT